VAAIVFGGKHYDLGLRLQHYSQKSLNSHLIGRGYPTLAKAHGCYRSDRNTDWIFTILVGTANAITLTSFLLQAVKTLLVVLIAGYR
jgi:hypothetical protein